MKQFTVYSLFVLLISHNASWWPWWPPPPILDTVFFFHILIHVDGSTQKSKVFKKSWIQFFFFTQCKFTHGTWHTLLWYSRFTWHQHTIIMWTGTEWERWDGMGFGNNHRSHKNLLPIYATILPCTPCWSRAIVRIKSPSVN